MYKYILFDLDGTLLNTYPGVSNAVKYTMDYYKKDVPEEKTLRKFLGPPLGDSLHDIAGIESSEIPNAIKKFREYYIEKGVFEYEFFEDLKPTFKKLREMGCVLAVATAKLEKAAFMMLRHAGILDEFDFVCGSLENTRVSKTDVIAHVLEHYKGIDRSEFLMVGDRENDVTGAKNNNIDCCGLLCGFGSKEELEENGAKYIIPFISDIFSIL